MSNLLKKSKELLKSHAQELYNCYVEDVPLTEASYVSHYSNLGKMVFTIDSIKSFGEMICELEKGTFDELGYCPGEEDLIEEFLSGILNDK